MENLINIFKKIKKNLILLEDLMNKEFNNLLNSKTNIDEINLITEEKAFILKKIIFLKEKKMIFEKSNNLSSPYLNNFKLNELWKEIVSKCLFLKQKNIKYKIILNKKFYLNQRFLNIYQVFESSKKNTTYDIDGNLKN